MANQNQSNPQNNPLNNQIDSPNQRNPSQDQDRTQRRQQGNQQSDLGNSTDRSLSEDEPFNSDDYSERTEGSRGGSLEQNQQSGRRDQKTDR